MEYRKYKQARNAAWRVLLKCNVQTLPVDLRVVCREMGCRLYSYQNGANLIRIFRLEKQTALSDGFTFIYDNVPYIFYCDTITESRQRFTIAHELGHIALGHLEGAGYAVSRSGKSDDETQANQFAARLLAPACVLNALDAVTPELIASLCGMSKEAASYRAKRLRQLRKRGKFLVHPLERRVLRRFRSFIQSHRGYSQPPA